MTPYVISVLGILLFLSARVSSLSDNELKRGDYPYMAFIYYSDDQILENNDTVRFFRGAVLVTPQYLVSSAIDTLDAVNGFPRKTLLARLGAVVIDANVTLNEDEGEQEREVIQVLRPSNRSLDKYWMTDITILKVLTPFNLTSAVNFSQLSVSPRLNTGKVCSALVFMKKELNTTERSLQALTVKPLTQENCGDLYEPDRMMCSAGYENVISDDEFCNGNSGGPLICDNEIVGLQSFYETQCKPPYIYHRVYFWRAFVNCGTHGECQSEHCKDICVVADKDGPENPAPEENVTVVDINTTELVTDVERSNETVEANSETAPDPSKIPEPEREISIEAMAMPEERKKLVRHRSSGHVAKISTKLIFWFLICKVFT